MSGTLAPSSPPAARRPRRKSPNRRRLVGRTILWTVLMGGAAIWFPHLWF